MNQMQYNEYSMLRNESMHYAQQKEEARKFVITTTIALLALAGNDMWINDKYIYLLTMLIIVFGVMRTISMERRTKDIIAYRIVFLENDNEIRWARAATKYDMNNNAKSTKIGKSITFLGQFDYAILGTLSIVIYIERFKEYIIDESGNFLITNIEFYILLLMIVILIYIVIVCMERKMKVRKDLNKLLINGKQ